MDDKNQKKDESVLLLAVVLGALLLGYSIRAVTETPTPQTPEPRGTVNPEFLVDELFVKFRFTTLDPEAAAEVEYFEEGVNSASTWEVWKDGDGYEYSTCVVWVPFPLHAFDDPAFNNIGHQISHCLLGNFH